MKQCLYVFRSYYIPNLTTTNLQLVLDVLVFVLEKYFKLENSLEALPLVLK